MARRNLLKGFKRPKGIAFEHNEADSNYGRFVAYPFERGYGTTIGNTLRRILLSSIQGYAVTAVKITSYDADNTPHIISSEYEAIPEVVEDTPEIIANLKLLQIKLPDDVEQKTILVECKGKGELAGKDLEKDNDITIVNKSLKIMTLMDKANIDLELQIDLGRGYVPSETNEKYIEVVGTIPIDAVFSPVKKVAFSIENTRVGHRNDYDKLVLDIWTDGTTYSGGCSGRGGEDREGSLHDLHQLRRGRRRRRRGYRRGRRACPPDSRHSGRRARALGSIQQLPEEREHKDDR